MSNCCSKMIGHSLCEINQFTHNPLISNLIFYHFPSWFWIMLSCDCHHRNIRRQNPPAWLSFVGSIAQTSFCASVLCFSSCASLFVSLPSFPFCLSEHAISVTGHRKRWIWGKDFRYFSTFSQFNLLDSHKKKKMVEGAVSPGQTELSIGFVFSFRGTDCRPSNLWTFLSVFPFLRIPGTANGCAGGAWTERWTESQLVSTRKSGRSCRRLVCTEICPSYMFTEVETYKLHLKTSSRIVRHIDGELNALSRWS